MDSKTLILSLKTIIALNFSLKVFASPEAVKRAEEVEREFIPYAISSVMKNYKNKTINDNLFSRLEQVRKRQGRYLLTMHKKQMSRMPKGRTNKMMLETNVLYIYEEETVSYCNHIYEVLGNEIKNQNIKIV